MSSELTEGWGVISRAGGMPKAHYFTMNNGFSLCMKRGFYNGSISADTGNETPGPDDCTACFKKLIRRRKAQATKDRSPAP